MSSTEEYTVKMAYYQRGFETRLRQLVAKSIEWPDRGMTKQAIISMPSVSRMMTPWWTRAMQWLGKKPGLVGSTLGAIGGGGLGAVGGAWQAGNTANQYYQNAIATKKKQLLDMGAWDRLGAAGQFLFNPKGFVDQLKF